jgi:hypothetical protein
VVLDVVLEHDGEVARSGDQEGSSIRAVACR